MIQIHQAREGELAAAGALWADTFGDGPDVQRDFYRLCGPGGPLVLTEDGELRAMLALPQVSRSFGADAPVRAGYVYALACAPARRGEGWASMLVETAAGLARNRGFECLLTVPAEPELFGFFAKNGFRPGFSLREAAAQPAPAPAAEVSPEEYAVLREGLLAGRAHTVYNSGQLAFQRGLCPHPGSGLYRLELAHGPGCAAVENWPGSPVVKELLCAKSDTEQGAGACAALCGAAVTVRVPAEPGEGRPFGAVRWLAGKAPARWTAGQEGWLGLAFD